MRLAAFIICILGTLLSVGGQGTAGSNEESHEKLLYLSLFYGDIYNAGKIDIASLPEDIQDRVREYSSRLSGFKSRLKDTREYSNPEARMIGDAVFRNRVNIERGIVSLIGEEGIEEIAAEYAGSATAFYEWEDFVYAPLGEAEHAIEFLNGNPETPLKPYLVVFIIHRHRHALKGIEYEKKYFKERPDLLAKYEKLEVDTLKTYEHYLEIGEKHPDPLVRWFSAYIANADSLF